MIQPFDFEHNGRTFTCTVEARAATPDDSWWWFGVSGDQQRYAGFRAASSDTRDSVKKRVIAYYDNLLERRARPPEPQQHWGRRGRPPNAPAAPANEIVIEPDDTTEAE